MADVESLIQYSDDISEAEAPAPIPVGSYDAAIRAAEVMESAKGNKYVAVQFHIPADQYPADFTDGDPDGTILVYRRVPVGDNQRARYQMRRFCESIGAKTGKQVDVNDWIGLTASVEVGHQSYEGETRAEIKKVSAAS